MENEHVLVVPTSLFRELGYFQGFHHGVDGYRDQLLRSENTSYRPRSEMETDPDFKQLIPYVIFRYSSEEGVFLFQYTRGKGQGEQRLHSKRSVGIGGHISSEDSANNEQDPYGTGMQRELEEEVSIKTTFKEQCVGLINDDESDVGKVHLGIVHIFDVEQPEVAPREDEIIEAGFRPVQELLADLDRFETWSQICLKALFA